MHLLRHNCMQRHAFNSNPNNIKHNKIINTLNKPKQRRKMSNSYIASKPRYEILDGLRGVAAVIVVLFHMFECYSPGTLEQIINHGYLAVDFFFALSGFVISYAYDNRWDRMTMTDFFKRRIIRLHPMVVFGTLFGACFFYINACDSFPVIETVPWYFFLLAIVWCLTLLPIPAWLDMRGTIVTNPFTDPVWSLQFEYIANIIYAFILRHLSKLAIAILCVVAAFFTVTLTMNIDLFGFLGTRTWAAYTVIGGWSFELPQIYIGLVRLATPFLLGILVARIGRFITIGNAFFWCALLVVGVTACPRLGGEEHMWMNGIYESAVIIIAFPLILCIGAGSKIRGRKAYRLCNFLGDISYPLYLTHIIYIYMLYNFKNNHPDAPQSMIICVCAGLFIASLFTAYAALKLYDMPVREYLKKRWFSGKRTEKNIEKK